MLDAKHKSSYIMGMNKLPIAKRVQILSMLCEGSSMRSVSRVTRLSNAFSKKLESHRNALSLYFYFYNWCRIHKTLRVTPAMAAGLTDKLLSFEELIARMDEAAPKPGRPKTYKKRLAV